MKTAFIDRIMRKTDVGSHSIVDDSRLKDNFTIIRAFEKLGAVTTYRKFSPYTYYNLENDCSNTSPYDVVITHSPFDIQRFEISSTLDYSLSLDLFKQMHDTFPGTVIIAYSGAGYESMPDSIFEEHGVSHVLRRPCKYQEGELEIDLKKMLGWVQ